MVKKIIFDLVGARTTKHKLVHGGRVYSENLLFYLHSLNLFEIILIQHAKDLKKIDSNLNIIKTSNYKDIQVVIDNNPNQIYINPLPGKYVKKIKFNNCEIFHVVHGMRDIEMPTDKYESSDFKGSFKKFMKHMFRKKYLSQKIKFYECLINRNKNTNIIFASEYTEKFFLQFFPKKKYSYFSLVLYPTFNLQNNSKKNIYNNDKEILDRLNLENKKYYLYTSANRWVKNPVRTIRACIKALDDLGSDVKFVIIGHTKNILNNNRIIYLDVLNDKEYEIVLKNAKLVVYTSLNEGFGLLPYEAGQYSTPTLCGAISSLSFLYSGYMGMVNPYSEIEIQISIVRYFEDQKYYNEMTQKSKKFSDFAKIKSMEQLKLLNLKLMNQIHKPLNKMTP